MNIQIVSYKSFRVRPPLSNMGSLKSFTCYEVTVQIQKWANQNNLWLSPAHVLGKKNVEADIMSRRFRDAIDSKLNPKIFDMLTQEFGRPSTDMFASYSKKQLDKYTSQYPEPFSIVEDAFNMSWNELCLYLFPPFKSRKGLRKDHDRSM